MEECGAWTDPELRSEIICVGLVDFLARSEDVVELIIVGLMDRLFERFVAFMFVRLESGQVLCYFFVSDRQLHS